MTGRDVVAVRARDDDGFELDAPGEGVGDALNEAGVDDRVRRATLLEDVGEPVGLQEDVRRHRHRADAGEREQRNRHLDAVREHEHDERAGPDTRRDERARKALGFVVQPAVRERALGEHDRHAVRIGHRARREHVGHQRRLRRLHGRREVTHRAR